MRCRVRRAGLLDRQRMVPFKRRPLPLRRSAGFLWRDKTSGFSRPAQRRVDPESRRHGTKAVTGFGQCLTSPLTRPQFADNGFHAQARDFGGGAVSERRKRRRHRRRSGLAGDPGFGPDGRGDRGRQRVDRPLRRGRRRARRDRRPRGAARLRQRVPGGTRRRAWRLHRDGRRRRDVPDARPRPLRRAARRRRRPRRWARGSRGRSTARRCRG